MVEQLWLKCLTDYLIYTGGTSPDRDPIPFEPLFLDGWRLNEGQSVECEVHDGVMGEETIKLSRGGALYFV